MSQAVIAFPECAGPAARLAAALGIEMREVSLHRFPDGESLVRVPQVAETTLLYRSLDRPNEKLVELLLAASAARDAGARRLILIVPYLAYMRQDVAFHEGEAVSQRVIGKLLAAHCDALVTVDPHLHRVASLAEVMPGIETVYVSAAPALAQALDAVANPLLVGPDAESRPWVEAIAHPARLDFVVGHKARRGDRSVEITIPDAGRAAGRSVVLVDDLLSTGSTLKAAAQLLHEAGASQIDVLATHCLASDPDIVQLRAAGVRSIRASDTTRHPLATLPIADALARQIRRRQWW